MNNKSTMNLRFFRESLKSLLMLTLTVVFSFNGKAADPCVVGDPSVIPSSNWNAYVYADNSFSNYRGFYTENIATGLGVNFKSATKWAKASNPSAASGYVGCALPSNDGFSISYKRQTSLAAGSYKFVLSYSAAANQTAVLYINGVAKISRPASGSSYTFAITANPVLEVRFSDGNTGDATVSLKVTAVVSAPLNPGTLISDQTICYNTTIATLSATAASGGCSGKVYQWQEGTSAAGPWSNIANSNSVNLSIGNLTSTKYYRRMVSDGGCSTPVYTSALTITVGANNYVVGSIASSVDSICPNIAFSLNSVVPASGGLAGTTPSYVWQTAPLTGTVWTDISGATSASYSPGSLSASSRFRRAVRFTGTCVYPSASTYLYSNVVTVIYKPNLTPVSPPVITGVSNVCNNTTSLTYTSSNISGATAYTWTAPSGASVTSGQGTKNAVITYSSGFTTTGIIQVAASNSCAATAQSTSIPFNVSYTPECISVWTGAVSTSWTTANNWSTGIVPTNSTEVSIPSGLSVYPSISGNVVAGKVTIQSGGIINLQNASAFLSFYGNFINNGTFNHTAGELRFLGSAEQSVTSSSLLTLKNVTFQNTAGVVLNSATSVNGIIKLVKGTVTSNGNLSLNVDAGALIDYTPGQLGSITGSITINRTIPQYTHYISSPLIGTDATQINDDVQVVNDAGTSSRLYQWNFTNQKWIAQSNLSNVVMGPGNSAVRMFFPTSGGDHLDFTGTYNHQASYSSGSFDNSAAGKYVLIGNPYPAPLNWNASSGWTLQNVSQTIYYWNQSLGVIATYNPTSGGTNGGTATIPMMQAFFVTTTGTGGVSSVGMSNDIRLETTASLYRTSSNDGVLKISVTDENNHSDETLINLTSANATSGFDNDLDGYKFKNPADKINVYTCYNGVEYSINTLPIDNETTISLNVEAPSAGSYKLKIPYDASLNAVLWDKKNGTVKKIDGSDYTFNVSSGDPNARFAITFGSANFGSNSGSVLTFGSTSSSAVLLAKNDIGLSDIRIYNTLGAEVKVIKDYNIQSGSNLIQDLGLPAGAYIVKVSNSSNEYTGHISLLK